MDGPALIMLSVKSQPCALYFCLFETLEYINFRDNKSVVSQELKTGGNC